MKYFGIMVFAALVVIGAATAGNAGLYHTGQTLFCYDCHTMHYSMQHNWDGTTPVPNKPSSVGPTGLSGNWLGSTGPNQFLLKAPANELCLSCHDGQSFAPDVMGANSNASPTQGRQAGALNQTGGVDTYAEWMGHTLGSLSMPPGYDPTKVGLTANFYDPGTEGLECLSCHIQHGSATVYRNLAPRSFATPTFVLNITNDTTKDVWINVASTYTAGTGVAATFNDVFDRAKINFNRNDTTVGLNKTSNGMDNFCGTCHGNFHGGPGDTNIGATPAALDGFIRHPTSQVTIGVAGGSTTAGGQGYGGHSTLTRYTTATTKVKTYSNNTDWTNASPGCITCHKGHGNNNPFGLIFLNRNATSVDEQGGWLASQTHDTQTGLRNLCGQCHSQGN